MVRCGKILEERSVVKAGKVLLFCAAVLWSRSSSAAISKNDLLALVDKKVDSNLILSLVQRDCVDFDVTPEVLLELSSKVPNEILQAAIACKSPADSKGNVSQAVDLASGPPLELTAVHTLAVIPLTLDGQLDNALTGVIVEELRSQKPRFKLIDPVEIAVHFEDKGSFTSDAPIKSLLAAARAVGAQAVLVGSGSSYRRFDDPAIRLDMKLVEVNQGKVLWSGGDKGVSNFYSWQTAKKNAARNTVKILP
jgi:TolB-like protein